MLIGGIMQCMDKGTHVNRFLRIMIRHVMGMLNISEENNGIVPLRIDRDLL